MRIAECGLRNGIQEETEMRIAECGFGIEIQKVKKVRNVDCGMEYGKKRKCGKRNEKALQFLVAGCWLKDQVRLQNEEFRKK